MKLPAATWREWDGPFTRELVREPGRFGLGQVPTQLAPDATATAICGFCSTGCRLKVHLRDGTAVNLTPDPDYPVNLGMACPKGWEALTPLDAPDRALTPRVDGRDATWGEAAAAFSARMKAIMARHGPGSVAFLSTGQMMTEEMFLLGAVAKFGMGFLHGDGNTRQCMATAVAAYKESFGFDAPPFSYQDFEESDVLVFIGANPCIAHPIMWQRVMRNRRRPKIVVIDPRTTETAMAATLHCAVKPKSDLALLMGTARVLLEGGVDESFVREHTAGFADWVEAVQPWTLERTAAETGLPASQIRELATLIREGTPRVSFWWTMGVNQGHQATRTAQAIINLALMTGNIGKPGTGANSITGQCNAMGSRLFSCTTGLPGARDFRDEAARDHIAEALTIPAARIPAEPGMAYDQIIEGVKSGAIRGLWVIATNPAHSWIDQKALHAAFDKLDLLVVQDMYPTTETAQRAHILLPAAGWGEKEGTFINSERRIGLSRKVRRAPGQALSDFRIFRLLAEAWGCGDLFKAWQTPEAVFRIMQRCTVGRPCDISGIPGYDALEAVGGAQWPVPAGSAWPPEPERRLFDDGVFFTADGRARFTSASPEFPPETPDRDWPLVLLTGRGTSAQWHTETRTGKSAVLRQLAPDVLILDMHPDDAAAAGLADAQRVAVTSRRGRITATLRITACVRPGQVFLPMHDRTVNQLTLAVFDPLSRQPAYKYCAVRVEPAD